MVKADPLSHEEKLVLFTVAAICTNQTAQAVLRGICPALMSLCSFAPAMLALCWSTLHKAVVACSSARRLLRALFLGGLHPDERHSRLALRFRRLLWLRLRWRCAGGC